MYSRQSPGVSANAAMYACTHSTQHSTARQHSKTANLLMFNNSQQSAGVSASTAMYACTDSTQTSSASIHLPQQCSNAPCYNGVVCCIVNGFTMLYSLSKHTRLQCFLVSASFEVLVAGSPLAVSTRTLACAHNNRKQHGTCVNRGVLSGVTSACTCTARAVTAGIATNPHHQM